MWPFRPHPLSGPAGIFLETVRDDRAFRHARIETRRRGRPLQKIIIGIGQVHGVGQGRFERFQVRRIADVQAWIFGACRALTAKGIVVFGQEGFSRPGEEAFYGRLSEETLSELRRSVKEPDGVRRFLRRTAREWRSALRRHDEAAIGRALTGLNSLNILQALDERVALFPIEQQQVHGPLAQALQSLHSQIEEVERQPAFRSVITKGGKGLTQEEYDAAMRRGNLIKQYNAVLSDDQRNDAIFEEVMRYSEHHDVTVFVLGQGHRPEMLAHAKRYLTPGMLFVWITPLPLWRPVIVRRVVIFLVIAVIAYALLRLR